LNVSGGDLNLSTHNITDICIHMCELKTGMCHVHHWDYARPKEWLQSPFGFKLVRTPLTLIRLKPNEWNHVPPTIPLEKIWYCNTILILNGPLAWNLIILKPVNGWGHYPKSTQVGDLNPLSSILHSPLTARM